MEIKYLDFENLRICKNCGIIFDKSIVKIILKKNEYDINGKRVKYYICPLCKNKNYYIEKWK